MNKRQFIKSIFATLTSIILLQKSLFAKIEKKNN